MSTDYSVWQVMSEFAMTGDGRDDQPDLITRRIFESAATAWSNYQIERTLSFMSEDVVHTLNVDGELVPFAASVRGKAAMREKLGMMLDPFEIGAYVTDHLTVQGNNLRANMKIIYIHQASGERLITNFRLAIEQRDGLMVQIDEFHDAAYLEAFVRYASAPAKARDQGSR